VSGGRSSISATAANASQKANGMRINTGRNPAIRAMVRNNYKERAVPKHPRATVAELKGDSAENQPEQQKQQRCVKFGVNRH
jgi:hypothetical protein